MLNLAANLLSLFLDKRLAASYFETGAKLFTGIDISKGKITDMGIGFGANLNVFETTYKYEVKKK